MADSGQCWLKNVPTKNWFRDGQLARNLEGGFNETGLEAMAEELPTERTFVAVEDDFSQ